MHNAVAISPEVNDLATRVIGAAIEVHRALGPGLPEIAYENAMCIELALRGISFERQKRIAVQYKGSVVGEGVIDLVVQDKLAVELKAVAAHNSLFEAQLIGYLRMTGIHLGLLINFNVKVLKEGIRRFANTL